MILDFTYLSLGMIYGSSNKYNDSIRNYKKRIELNPEFYLASYDQYLLVIIVYASYYEKG